MCLLVPYLLQQSYFLALYIFLSNFFSTPLSVASRYCRYSFCANRYSRSYISTFHSSIFLSFFLSFCLQVFPSSLELCLSVKSNIGWKRKCNFWMFEHYWIPALYRLLLLRYKQMFRLNWKLFFSRLWNSFFVVWLLKSRTTSEPAKALLKISLAHSLPSEWVFLGEHKQFKLDSSTY